MDTTRTAPSEPDNTPSPAPASNSVDLGSILYWELPQLDVAEANDLARAVYPEVEWRVGERISAGCSDDELEEFSELTDAGDDERCGRWLDEHVPDHPIIAAVEVEAIITETVATVDRAEVNLGSELRCRRARRIDRVGPAFLGRILDLQRRQYVVDGDELTFLHDGETAEPLRFELSVVSGGVLCLHSTYPQEFPLRRLSDLRDFAHRWNAAKHLPKAYAVNAFGASTCSVAAELAVPIAPGIHGQLGDHMVDVGTRAICRMFDELTDREVPPGRRTEPQPPNDASSV